MTESLSHLPPAYYSDDLVTLYHGDCRAVLPAIGQRFDLCIADPPYGDTSLDWDAWPPGWPEAVAQWTESMWCYGSMRMFGARWPELENMWTYSQDIIWKKHNGSGFHNDRFRRVHEFALHWYQGNWADIYKKPLYTNDARKRTVRRKERPAHTGEIANSTYTSEDGGPRLRTSVLEVRSMHGKAIHPTEKPLGIIEPLIEYACPPGGIVLDAFSGSGAALLAAVIGGRRAVGIEKEERYCEAIAKRLSQGVLDFGEVSLLPHLTSHPAGERQWTHSQTNASAARRGGRHRSLWTPSSAKASAAAHSRKQPKTSRRSHDCC